MKLKLFVTLLLFTIISGIGIVTATSRNTDKNAERNTDRNAVGVTNTPLASVSKVKQGFTADGKVINGAVNPVLIPDNIAYSLLFRLVAGNQDTEAKKRIRHYVRQMGLGKCETCSEEQNKNEDRGTEQDFNAFIATAEEFQRRVSPLDQQAIELKKQNWSNLTPQVKLQLTQLQRQKEAIVAEIVASLPQRLTTLGLNKVRFHLNERVKKNIKLNVNQEVANKPLSVSPFSNNFSK